jgi:hypothetical protein
MYVNPRELDRMGEKMQVVWSAGLRLAGLLLDDERLRTRWTDRVVLVDDDEIRHTEWMTDNLRVSRCVHTAPRDVERAIIERLHRASMSTMRQVRASISS